MLKFINKKSNMSDATATINDILNSKTAYSSNGKITGSMPNNGSLEYIPSDEEQNIPLGYTSGGIVKAIDLINTQSYKKCLKLSNDILEKEKNYIPMEYIKSTGTQYINTNYIPNDNTIIEICVEINDISNTQVLIGSRKTYQNADFCFWTSYNGGQMVLGWGKNVETSKNYPLIGQKAIILINNGTFIIKDMNNKIVYSQNITKSSLSNAKPLTILAYNFEDGIGHYQKNTKLYYCKIWENDVLKGNFVPAKNKTTNEVGLYDNVSEKFYYNAGTGEFVVPKEIVRPETYTALEYIDSTGTQKIDTGIDPTTINKLEFKFIPTQLAHSYQTYLAGGGNDDFSLGAYNVLNRSFLRYRTSEISTNIQLNNTDVNTLTIGEGKIKINDTEFTRDTSNGIATASNSICIFAQSYENNSSNGASMKFYGLKLWNKSEILVADFVPVINTATNELGVLNKVNNEFLTNVGTGKFTAPVLYTQLEYIQSTGTQYIDTTVKGSNTTKIEIKFQRVSQVQSSNEDSVIGSRDNKQYGYLLGFYSNGWMLYGSDQAYAGANLTDGIETLRIDKNKVYQYNEITNEYDLIKTYANVNFTTSTNMTLFAERLGGAIANKSAIKLYYCKIYNNDELVKDFIPAKDENGVICLYDNITKRCYYNTGTGDFISGGEI